MSESLTSPSVLIVSSDTDLLKSIEDNNSTDHTFSSSESVQNLVNTPDLLDNNGIVIFDIATADNDVSTAIDQIIKIKQTDPTQVLMVVGDKDPLNDILKSNIQPLVYRAFNKPISPNQIFLAFKSASALNAELIAKQAAGEDISYVGPQENRANLNTLAEERKTNPAIYAGIGVVAIGIIAWLFLAGGGEEQPQNVIVTQNTPTAVEENNEAADLTEQINELNQLASNALFDGRYISPKGDNALEYYDQVLAIDPYDSTAYDGRKAVSLALRESYKELVADAKFDEALKVVNALGVIDPLNIENDDLHEDLEVAISNHVKNIQQNGSAEEIAESNKVLAKIESVSKSAADALKAEQVLIEKIKAALTADNLTPPKKDNAYSQLSNALKGNKISKTNADPLIQSLSGKLVDLAKENLANDKFDETSKLTALIKRISSDNKEAAAINKQMNARKLEIAAEKKDEAQQAELAKQAAEAEANKQPARIIPAKIISRAAPRYPARALQKNIEGWVEVTFKINTKGEPIGVLVKNSEPEGVFDSAAIKSVKKWRFSPARNQETGLPVESTDIVTKVQFKLN